MLILYFARERYGMRRTRNDKGHSHNRGGRTLCIEASSTGQTKEKYFGIFTLNMPWEKTTGCNAITAFQQIPCSDPWSFIDCLSCSSVLIQPPSSFSFSASRNATFPFRIFPASLWLTIFLAFNSPSQGCPLSPLLHDWYFFFLELYPLSPLGLNR